MAGCLEEGTVLAFLGGTLAPAVRSTVEAHVADCSACADLVTWAAADQASRTGLSGIVGRPFVGQLQPGARVGRYQILGALGRGGMGEVYAAYHPELDRRIALKVVQGFDGGSGQRRSRLLREARAIARLSHPNVVTVHDAGTFGDRVFIAMELIDGQTIEQWLRAARRTWQAILEVFLAAGRGLAAAHAAGVVHRDFKPQNVMIAKDGIVRVMDFGLARLAAEDPTEERGREAGENDPTVPIDLITKTGAFIGTPAYMSPEQFRREATDARSDQFSFCIALHEALFGTRPAAESAEAGSPTTDIDARSPRRASAPGWLRQIVLRGAAPNRERRYPSMHTLLTALERARSRPRRRVLAVAAAMTVLLLSGGGWRLAHGNRFVCAVPKDRVGAAWAPGDITDARRQSIQRAFAASGRATADTSWQRVSNVLDAYMTAWSTMYLQTCEATHVRGEQSADVLDLRMACLNDNLDQVRALTNVLATADATAVSHAVTASRSLTPVSRCADIRLLKSLVPLPRDERKLREVQRLRKELAQVRVVADLGSSGAALHRATALRDEIEATEYEPLLAELLRTIGFVDAAVNSDPSDSEAALREAMIAAQASRDDLAAAEIAADLVYVIGYRIGRQREAEFWARLGHAILDRVGGDHSRLRSWLLLNLGATRFRAGDFDGARALTEQSVRLKEQCVGAEHPDVAASLSGLAYILTVQGRYAEGLTAANRAIEILSKASDPDSYVLGYTYGNQGATLNGLSRYKEAETAFKSALAILAKNVGAHHEEIAAALHGLGEVHLAQGAPREAIPFLEEALRVRQRPHIDPTVTADTEFALARALRQGNGDRARTRDLALAALRRYRDAHRAEREHAVEAWLAEQARSSLRIHGARL